MANESSFLQTLKMDKGEKSKAQKREDLLTGASQGSQILDLHGKLQDLADQLDEKVERKLNKNENAFFLAYWDHMHTVQREFKELKKKADEEETKTRRDARIQALEKELDWFMNEALRLDEQCKRHKRELDRWKSKAEALEDDRSFLESQIKNAKRQNRSLRGSVEAAQKSAYSALVDAEQEPVTASAPEQQASPVALSTEMQQRYQDCIDRLRRQLESEQRLAAKLRAMGDRQFGDPSELEAYFLQCVDRVRGEVADRRRRTAEYNRSMSAGRSTAPAPEPDVGIEDFTQADRRRILELLLSSEQVLQFLYSKLFPAADA
jgi:chromosome segregation ATPase